MTTQGPIVGGLPQPPPGAVGWWQASDTLWYPPESRSPHATNSRASSALVLGVVGIVLPNFGFALGPPAIVLGVTGYRRTTEDPALPGRTKAIVGSILGGLATVIGLAFCVAVVWIFATDTDESSDDASATHDQTAQAVDRPPSPRGHKVDYSHTVDCIPGDDGFARVEGTLTNNGDDRRSFDIELEVGSVDGRRTFPSAQVDDVAPGETVEWATTSSALMEEVPNADPNAGVVARPTCRVADVRERSVTP
ncbi:MAG: DUF4190 domain-containing protein [Acidimicrobiia bacterium]